MMVGSSSGLRSRLDHDHDHHDDDDDDHGRSVAWSLVVRAGILQRSRSAVGAVAEGGNVAAYLSVITCTTHIIRF